MPRQAHRLGGAGVDAPMASGLPAMPCTFGCSRSGGGVGGVVPDAPPGGRAMNSRPEITRRDFVRGRFLAGNNAAADSPPPRDAPDAAPDGMIMRYPTAADLGSMTKATAAAAPESHPARRRTIPVLRPPGAIHESAFLAGCTRCNECITACPYDAIVHAPARTREAAGTPMVDPDRQACLMCADFPCISACEPQVLSPRVTVAMGTAKVIAQTCLAHQGTTCTACSEQCPVPDAIEVVNGKPAVREEICTGCGVCRYVCPAPENAILLMPTFVRPQPPASP